MTVAKETDQGATFLWENATAMWRILPPGSHERAYWLINPTLLPSAASMNLKIGTAGALPPGGFASDGRGGYTLLGRPVIPTSRLPIAGQRGDVLLFDPNEYAFGLRSGLTIDRSEHAYFSSDQLAIRARFRGDGAPLWDAVRTGVDGSSYSPFVTLEARP